MMNVHHENVLEMITHGQGEYVRGGDKPVIPCNYIALHLAQEETLFDYIINSEPFPESMALVLFE